MKFRLFFSQHISFSSLYHPSSLAHTFSLSVSFFFYFSLFLSRFQTLSLYLSLSLCLSISLPVSLSISLCLSLSLSLSLAYKVVGNKKVRHTWSRSYQTFFLRKCRIFPFFATKLGHCTVHTFFITCYKLSSLTAKIGKSEK